MNEIKILDKTFKPFISDKEIISRVFDMSKMVEKDYKTKNPIFLAVLNGSFIFVADFIKNFNAPCQVEFIKLKSYEGTASTGKVIEQIGLQMDLKDQHIVILEDIVDTGKTLEQLLEILEKYKPASVKIASLLYKPASFKCSYNVDYIGFEIPEQFIVGYGLDYDGYGRNLKEIYTLVS
jgi:hypoxanthine phosphoribosyltransferase